MRLLCTTEGGEFGMARKSCRGGVRRKVGKAAGNPKMAENCEGQDVPATMEPSSRKVC